MAFLLVSTVFSARAADLQTLHGHVPPSLNALTPTGRLPANTRLNLAIGLPLRNAGALSNLLQQIYEPGSPNYHHYLTPAQFTEQFGPTEGDYQAVVAFAKANHLQVTDTHASRMLLDVSGSVADVEQAFHVTLRTYQHPTENRTFYAPDTEPSLNLSVPVLHISGLDNFVLPHPLSHKMPSQAVRSVVPVPSGGSPTGTGGSPVLPAAGSGPGGAYMGQDFRVAYAPGVSLTGAGQSVGLLQFNSGFYQSDITAYETQAGLPNVPVQAVLLDGYNGGPGQANDEVSLDIEMVISMAPGVSQIYVFEGGNTDDILSAMAASNQVQQLSASWSYPIDATSIQIFQEFAAQGQSFFNASGDYDAWVGSIYSPCDNPYITIVGGTTLSMSGTGSSYSSETVWNWGTEYGRDGIGSGGGISTVYPIPDWQTNVSMSANGGSTTMRNIPDVALTADNVWVVYGGGSAGSFGGTSCATPLWAGFAALVNQQAASSGQSPIGFINPAVYAIASGPNYAACFHDITTGNNTWSQSPSIFYAVPGYDLCTGLGTPTGQSLINALANPEPLIISPNSGFTAIGGVGGPFFPVTSQDFTLTNIGTNTLTWTLSNTSVWLNVSSTSGTLAPAGPAAVVTVSLNDVASNLVVGAYSATLWFTNQNDNFGQSRTFTLSVIAPPSITQQPADQAVLEGATATFNVQATGGLPLVYQWQFNGTNLTDGDDIVGSATSNLTISAVSAANVGNYTVVVTNFAGTAISSNAALTLVPSPPIITLQPTNLTVYANVTVQFAVGVIGTTPYSYQWNFNGTNLPAATNATLTLTNVQLDQSGNYSVLVTNIYGPTNSDVAVLTVNPPPPCDPLPSGIVAWWRAENNALDTISGNNGTLMNGTTFTNGEVGTAFNLNGINNYVLANPSVSSNLDVGQGSGLTFEGWINPTTVTAEELLFEYERALGTGSGSDVGIGFAIHANSGGILYANLSDTSSTSHEITSPGGILTPGIWQHVALTYDKASGLAVIYLNGTNVAQVNFGTFTPQTSFTNLLLGARTTFNSVSSPGSVYSGKLDEISLYDRALSSNEIAAIYQASFDGKCFTPTPPVITGQPTNQMAPVGGTAAFSVVASGTPPLAYQWSFNGTNIVGATNATLILANVQFNQSGNCAVLVSNPYGFTNSDIAALTVYGLPPVITTQPADQSVLVGGTATFTVTAGGTPPLSYQWSFNGTNLLNATNATLVLTNVQYDQAGGYSVLISNLFGFTNSDTAVLTVNQQSSCDPVPPGIVAWWQAEGNALDKVAGNNGTLMNGTTFINGEVGMAFNLNGINNYVIANPSSPTNLDVGQGSGLTFEEWINPNTVTAEELLFEYERALGTGSGSDVGIGFAIHADSGGILYANVTDTGSISHEITSPAGLLTPGVWQHVALTYDKASGLAVIYLNGASVAQMNLGSFTPQTSFTNLLLGARTTYNSVSSPGAVYSGELDEISLYNRALTAAEIQAIYQSGTYGKCVSEMPPTIIIQPTNQTVQVGGTANFTVAANGTPPLAYQWNFNGTNIPGATNATLTLANVQLSQAGNYSVQITNLFGSTNSTAAVLTVNPPPCDPVPSAIVAWWQAENNAFDAIGGNNGTLMNGTGFATGEVGTAFNLNGINNYVLANPALPSNLDVGQGSGLTFEEWINPTTVTAEELLFEYERALGTGSGSDVGIGFAIHADTGGILYANLTDTSSTSHEITSPGGLLTPGVWQHVALTYDKASGLAVIYLNGTNVAQVNFGSFTPLTSFTNLLLGARTTFNSVSSPGAVYSGKLDEISLYNRALSSNEIAAIYQAGSNGKCISAIPPTITTQPANQTVQVGGTATFAVTASGTPPLAYQWSFNGTNILNATNATLTLANVQLGQSGNYSVLVGNIAGSTNSVAAVLTVYGVPPNIVTQPTNQTVMAGSTMTFAVAASGTSPLAYQWSFNGTNLVGATNSILTLKNVQLIQSGNYSVLVTNLFGFTNSATAVLTVNPPPPCDPPSSDIVAWWAAESNALDSVANNNGILMNGTTFTNGEVGMAFKLNGINNYVIANSSSPTNLDVGQGSGLTFEEWINPNTVTAEELLFEYERALGTFSGSDVGIGFAIHADSGGILYANVTDTGSISHEITSPAGLLVPGVWQHVALTYDKASGLAVIYLNGASVAQANFGSFTPQTSFTNLLLGARTTYNSVSSPGAVYSGELDEISLYNRALSSNEIAAIYQAGSNGKCPLTPTILSQPTNQSVSVNGTAMFRVVASGTPTLTYQWSFNGTNLMGATNATLTLTGVQPANAGNYAVLVANAFGATNSTNAVLTVQGVPVITTQPTNQAVLVGGSAGFSVTVSGATPMNCQWLVNGTNISGATNTTLTLANVQLANSGNYSVQVTNVYGAAVSSNATLTVIDTLDHFVWNQVPSPRFVNAPFGVTVQAMDSIGQLFTNFNGTVALTTTNGMAVNPSSSSSFVQGVWSGSVSISQVVSNLVLQADDGAGHIGLANPINVVAKPSLSVARSGGSLLIFWPMDPAGFSLEFSTNLPQWSPVTAPPLQVGNQWLESIQISYTNQMYLYRLRYTLP